MQNLATYRPVLMLFICTDKEKTPLAMLEYSSVLTFAKGNTDGLALTLSALSLTGLGDLTVEETEPVELLLLPLQPVH